MRLRTEPAAHSLGGATEADAAHPWLGVEARLKRPFPEANSTPQAAHQMKVHPAYKIRELLRERVKRAVAQNELAVAGAQLKPMLSQHLEASPGPRGAESCEQHDQANDEGHQRERRNPRVLRTRLMSLAVGFQELDSSPVCL